MTHRSYIQKLEGRNKIVDSREDMSDFLFHFTKGPNSYETLCKILSDGKLIDINNTGFICFTEAPLSMLQPMFEYFMRQYLDNPKFAPYGIGVSKKKFFELGGRPVIYGTKEEKDLLDPSIHWRFEEMNLPIPDFSWLREWRINKREIKFSPKGILVITNTEDEQTTLCHKLIDNTPEDYFENDGAFIDIERGYPGVSMEKLKDFNSKHDLLDLLMSQLDQMI